MSLANNHRVTKSNRLIEACYRVTLEEQRLLLACISQIDSRNKRMPSNEEIKITTRHYAETFGININSAYSQLKTATDTLFEREIKVGIVGDPGGYKRIRWVSEVTYPEGEGCVKLRFSKAVEPLLYQLGGEFTSYQLKAVAGLRSVYSIRIYELIMQFKRTGERSIHIDEFRRKLELNNRYKMFADMRKRVIEPAIKELNSQTDLEFSWEPVKAGRKIEYLIFTAKKQGQRELPL